MLKSVAIAMALVLSVGLVQAGPLEDGVAAFEQGNFAKAKKLLTPLAEADNARAQVYLGVMYYNGQGVKESNTQAFNWFLRAAERGNPEGQFQVGQMYAFGFGVPASETHPEREAIKWFTAAADKGHAEAQYNLGLMYIAGTGVVQDHTAGMEWIRKAAKGGFEEAKQFVGDYN